MKPILIAVHGMGSHSKDSFKHEVSDALTSALKLYPGFEDKTIEMYLQLEVIEYNHIFEYWRKKMAQDSTNKLNVLKLSSSHLSLIKEGLEIHSKIGKDDNIYSYWLDIVFYMTLIGEEVRVSVAEQFIKIYNDAFIPGNNNPLISILATSLGTAVTHDTLSKLYMDFPTESELKKKWKELKLDAGQFHIHSLFQIANISRLLKTFSNPYTSIVRPGSKGCCDYMYNFDHGLDPIPNIAPFKPDKNEGWLTTNEWDDQIFIGEKIHEITKVNVHNLSHYIANPNVHLRIFRTVIHQFSASPDDAKKVYNKFLGGSMKNNAESLRTALSEIKITDIKSIKQVIDAIKKTAKIIKTYEELT